MNCERWMQQYMGLDSGESLPLPLRIHTLFCARCRAEIRGMEMALLAMQRFAPPSPEDLSREIMSSVMRGVSEDGRIVPLYNWVAGGILLLAGVILVRFGDSFIWLKERFGIDLELPLAIVLGVVLSVYAAVFVGTHIEELARRRRAPKKSG